MPDRVQEHLLEAWGRCLPPILPVLGLPDEYDHGYEAWGLGYWTLMVFGSWTTYPTYERFSGNSPTHPSAWSTYRLGFVNPIVVTPDQLTSAVLPPIETEPVIYRIDVP